MIQVDELVDELVAGRHVVVLGPTHNAGRWWFDRVADKLAGEAGVTLRRSNGSERVDHASGGWVRFGSVASGMWRGLTADTLALDVEPSDDQAAGLFPMLATAAAPRVIRGYEV